MGLLQWLESTAAAACVRESIWGYPIVLCSHAVGMAVVVGVVLMMNLRVLGYAPRIPVTAFGRLFVFAWIGLALNAASGVLLFAADAVRFLGNWAFLFKMALIVAGGISVRVLLATTMRETDDCRQRHRHGAGESRRRDVDRVLGGRDRRGSPDRIYVRA